MLLAACEDQYCDELNPDDQYSDELNPDALEQVNFQSNAEIVSTDDSSSIPLEGTDGKPGLVSFYNRPYKRQDDVSSNVQRTQGSPLWFLGPAVLVASFIFPSLYLRRILSTVFEDSLLTGNCISLCWLEFCKPKIYHGEE